MLDSLPELKLEDVNLNDVIANRDSINGIIAYLAVVASSLASTPHLTGKQLAGIAITENIDKEMIGILKDLPLESNNA